MRSGTASTSVTAVNPLEASWSSTPDTRSSGTEAPLVADGPDPVQPGLLDP